MLNWYFTIFSIYDKFSIIWYQIWFLNCHILKIGEIFFPVNPLKPHSLVQVSALDQFLGACHLLVATRTRRIRWFFSRAARRLCGRFTSCLQVSPGALPRWWWFHLPWWGMDSILLQAEKEGSLESAHVTEPCLGGSHFGILCCCCADLWGDWLQALCGFEASSHDRPGCLCACLHACDPHINHSKNSVSAKRWVWEYCHRITGAALLSMGIYQLFSDFGLYAEKHKYWNTCGCLGCGLVS